MQFDVTTNLTLEVDDEVWKDFLEMNYEDAEGNPLPEDEAIFDGAVEAFLEEELGSEEMSTYSGRAWVCSIDGGSIL